MAALRLRLQLLSLSQGLEALDLLRFCAASGHATPRASVWSRGEEQPLAAASVEELLSALPERRFNEISVDQQWRDFAPAAGGELTLKRVVMSLRLAPTHALWADTRPAGPEAREAGQRRATCESLARALRWNELTRYPTLLDARCDLRAPAGRPTLGAWQEFLQGALAGVPAQGTGYGDCGAPAPVDVLQRLAPWPRGCAQLDTRFAGWHELLVGPPDLCAGLARALGVEARELCVAGRRVADRSLLLVPEEHLRARSVALERVAEFFVARDASTAHRELDASAGEFRVGGHVYYSAARQSWLDERRALAEAPVGHRYERLLAEDLCRVLGVEASRVLVTLLPSGALDALHGEIRARLAGLPVPTQPRDAWLVCRAALASTRGTVLGRERAEVIGLLGRLTGLEG